MVGQFSMPIELRNHRQVFLKTFPVKFLFVLAQHGGRSGRRSRTGSEALNVTGGGLLVPGSGQPNILMLFDYCLKIAVLYP
jgi:hypothetical protein